MTNLLRLGRSKTDASKAGASCESSRTSVADPATINGDNPPCKHIDGLPDELLAHVFAFTIDSRIEASQYRSPLLLTYVCRRWCNVTRARPLLWTHIHSSRLANPKLIRLFIARSQGAPLHVSCDYIDMSCHPGWNGANLESFQMLVAEAKKWGSVDFDLGDKQTKIFYDKLGLGATVKTTSLTHISLNMNNCDEYTVRCVGTAIGGVCWNTKVESLSLTATFSRAEDLLYFPLGKIPKIAIKAKLRDSEIMEIMEECKTATSLSFDLAGDFMPEKGHSTKVRTYNKIKSFKIAVKGDPIAILQRFSFPSLEGLDIEVYDETTDRQDPVAWLTNAPFRLKRFHLEDRQLGSKAADSLKDCPPLRSAYDVKIVYEP